MDCLNCLSLLPPVTKLRQGNVFTPVCHSVHGGVSAQHAAHDQGGLLGGSLSGGSPSRRVSPGGSLSRRACLSGRGVSVWEGGVCPGGGCLSRRGVSVQGVSVQGRSPVQGGLCLGGLCPGGSQLGIPPQTETPAMYGNEPAVRFLLECMHSCFFFCSFVVLHFGEISLVED